MTLDDVSGAHPRLRGADSPCLKHSLQLEGSSPLTRGGRRFRRQDSYRLRLIPAYAGRTYYSAYSAGYARAHPRLRGADALEEIEIVLREGSSPLTRGGQLP